ncbi:MAG: DUF3488 and transglutaminase-like domain-containing protein [Nitriliruptoraceae bacterium]
MNSSVGGVRPSERPEDGSQPQGSPANTSSLSGSRGLTERGSDGHSPIATRLIRAVDGRTRGVLAMLVVMFVMILPAYGRVFTDASWRLPAFSAGVAALVIVVAMNVFKRGMAATAVVSGLALLFALPWMLGLSSRPVVPGPTTMFELLRVLADGLVEVNVVRAPTEPFLGMRLIVVGAWWIVGHVAAEAVVRKGRPGIALIALMVLWASPLVAWQAGRTWTTAVPFMAAAAFTMLISRPAGIETGPRSSKVVPAAGTKLAVFAISIGAIAPGILPGYGERGWVSVGSSAGRGYEAVVNVSQRLGQQEPRDLFRTRISHRTYLRLAGLDYFDGRSWRLASTANRGPGPQPDSMISASELLPFEVSAARTHRVVADIEVLDFSGNFLPVPYQPLAVSGPERHEMAWSREGGFLLMLDMFDEREPTETSRPSRTGLDYRVVAARPAPTFADLVDVTYDPETLAQFTELPQDYTELGAVAEEVYRAAGATSPVEKALALQDWFADPEGLFSYSLDVPALADDGAVAAFVFEQRVGYCVHFATAMAVMLRQTGIPARVALGFLPGRVTGPPREDQGDVLTEFTVSTADAHVWVEVLFPDHGWISFEPTPRGDRTQIVPRFDDLAPLENVRQREARELAGGSGDESQWFDDEFLDDEFLAGDLGLLTPAETTPTDDDDMATSQVTAIVVAAVLAAVLIVAIAVHVMRTRIPPHATARARLVAAQRFLLATAASYGIGRLPHETLPEVIDRWRREHRTVELPKAVVASMQAAAFGGDISDEAADEVIESVGSAVAALRKSVPLRHRLVAPLRLPVTGMAIRMRSGYRKLVALRRRLSLRGRLAPESMRLG